MTTTRVVLAAALLAAPAGAAVAQSPVTVASSASPSATAADTIEKPTAAEKKAQLYRQQVVQNYRFNDQRGINVFEAPKAEGVPFTGFKMSFGAAFTQQFQGLGHSNRADSVRISATDPRNANRLIEVGHGFNNAVANLYLDAQLAKGIRVAMTSYLSSRHHNETWVKDGYFLIDDTPIDLPILNALMKVATVKAGHFEVNYGDQHFRRTDNGNAMYNPLVGNLLADAFTTSVGAEVYLRKYGFLAMGGVTNGEVRGMTLNPGKRAPAFLGKLGWDGQVTPDLRVRLTGSAFTQSRAASQTLFSGDRAGSRYYNVLENQASSETANFRSGAVVPDFNEMHAQVINPFIKFHGLELFANIERVSGRTAAEQKLNGSVVGGVEQTVDPREFSNDAYELTYRLLGDQLYLSARTNVAKGRWQSTFTDDAKMTRNNFGGGWFITPTVLLKGEYVNQKYDGFARTDIRSGGQFKGWVAEGVVSF
jgi:hypothetical protein